MLRATSDIKVWPDFGHVYHVSDPESQLAQQYQCNEKAIAASSVAGCYMQ